MEVVPLFQSNQVFFFYVPMWGTRVADSLCRSSPEKPVLGLLFLKNLCHLFSQNQITLEMQQNFLQTVYEAPNFFFKLEKFSSCYLLKSIP